MQTGLSNKPGQEYRNEDEQKSILSGKRLDVCGKFGNAMGNADARKAWVAKMGNGKQFNGQSGGKV